jgi:hypothetical protein
MLVIFFGHMFPHFEVAVNAVGHYVIVIYLDPEPTLLTPSTVVPANSALDKSLKAPQPERDQ